MIQALYTRLTSLGPSLVPTLSRATFAATLAGYYWASALTKLDGFGLSVNAYAQIFPKAMEAVNYDASQLSILHTLVVLGGTVAEFVLPLCLILGLLTRPAALGMIGFILLQTLTDLFGHGALSDPATLGIWFDRVPDSLILDQRLLWITLLLPLVLMGAGPLSLDRVTARWIGPSRPSRG